MEDSEPERVQDNQLSLNADGFYVGVGRAGRSLSPERCAGSDSAMVCARRLLSIGNQYKHVSTAKSCDGWSSGLLGSHYSNSTPIFYYFIFYCHQYCQILNNTVSSSTTKSNMAIVSHGHSDVVISTLQQQPLTTTVPPPQQE